MKIYRRDSKNGSLQAKSYFVFETVIEVKNKIFAKNPKYLVKSKF